MPSELQQFHFHPENHPCLEEGRLPLPNSWQGLYGGCAKFFGTKMALAPALGEPCAFLARPQSRLNFCLSIFSCPVLVLVFV